MNMKEVRSIGARIAAGGKTKGSPIIDASAIRELADLLGETGLTEIEIEQGGSRLRVARQIGGTVVAEAPMQAVPTTVAEGSISETTAAKGPPAGAVPSPMVGTVYVASEPGAPPFVKVGDKIAEGDTLLIVEAMKTMNPILAPRTGTVSEICVHDAEPVEFGQTLLVIS
jgi:acetyl-CoA carboxylase biotin carboxyl carrier protein